MQQEAIEASQVRMVNLLVATQGIVGGSWVDEDGGAEICTSSSGVPGASFPLVRSRPGVPTEQQKDLVDAVVGLWAKAGYPGVVSPDVVKGADGTAVSYPAKFGVDKDGTYLKFGLSIAGAVVIAQTPCVVGDADACNEAHPPKD